MNDIDDYDPQEGLPSNDELLPEITSRTVADWPAPSAGFAETLPRSEGDDEDIPLRGLSPEHRTELTERLKDTSPHDKAGQRRVFDAWAAEKSLALRRTTGPGSNATAYDKELHQIELDVMDINRQAKKAMDLLGEVVGFDQETGKPILRYPEGSARWHALMDEVQYASYRLGLLRGSEGEARLAGAAKQSCKDHRDRLRQIREAEEVQRRTAKTIREDRINAQVAARTVMRDRTV